MKERTQQMVAKLAEKELDAVLISAPENRRYLSGFTGSAGWLLLSQGQSVLVTDSRYTEQAGHQAPDYQVIQVKGGGWAWLLELLKSSGVRRLGFESQNMTVATHQSLLDALKADSDPGKTSLVPTAGLTEDLRIIKDAEELVLLQKAIAASDAAMTAVCPAIQDGMTEREVAWRMEVAMREFGADAPSFDTIVADGAN